MPSYDDPPSPRRNAMHSCYDEEAALKSAQNARRRRPTLYDCDIAMESAKIKPTLSETSLHSTATPVTSEDTDSGLCSSLSYDSRYDSVASERPAKKGKRARLLKFFKCFGGDAASMCLGGKKWGPKAKKDRKYDITNTFQLGRGRKTTVRFATVAELGSDDRIKPMRGNRISYGLHSLARESYCSFVSKGKDNYFPPDGVEDEVSLPDSEDFHDAQESAGSPFRGPSSQHPLGRHSSISGASGEAARKEGIIVTGRANSNEVASPSRSSPLHAIHSKSPSSSRKSGRAVKQEDIIWQHDGTMLKQKLTDKKTFPQVPKDCDIKKQHHTWTEASTPWRLRGPNYLADKVKIPAKEPYMELVAGDLFDTKDAVVNYAEWAHGAVQELRRKGDDRFMLIVNWMFPPNALAIVFALPKGNPGTPMWQKFANEMTNEERNARWKVIPCCVDGPWIVKAAVGTVPAIIGKKLKTDYKRGDNYLEVTCDVFSSAAAKTILGVIKGASKRVSIDLAYVIEAKEENELPEELIGHFRIFRPDTSIIPHRPN